MSWSPAPAVPIPGLGPVSLDPNSGVSIQAWALACPCPLVAPQACRVPSVETVGQSWLRGYILLYLTRRVICGSWPQVAAGLRYALMLSWTKNSVGWEGLQAVKNCTVMAANCTADHAATIHYFLLTKTGIWVDLPIILPGIGVQLMGLHVLESKYLPFCILETVWLSVGIRIHPFIHVRLGHTRRQTWKSVWYLLQSNSVWAHWNRAQKRVPCFVMSRQKSFSGCWIILVPLTVWFTFFNDL